MRTVLHCKRCGQHISFKKFTWGLTDEGMTTMKNRNQRNLKTDGICHLCGDNLCQSKGTHGVAEKELRHGAETETPENLPVMAFDPDW